MEKSPSMIPGVFSRGFEPGPLGHFRQGVHHVMMYNLNRFLEIPTDWVLANRY